ncbi:MAG: hypothetical protein ACREX9_00245 [Gammaproteobacteria bacterium]
MTRCEIASFSIYHCQGERVIGEQAMLSGEQTRPFQQVERDCFDGEIERANQRWNLASSPFILRRRR